MSNPTGRRLRAFFAFWPDPGTARAIVAAAPAGVLGVHPDDLHLTLLFLGAVDVQDLDRLAGLAADLPAMPFDLELERLERWRASTVVLVPRAIPGALTMLREQLVRCVGASVPVPNERGFRPHVTLATRATTTKLPGALASAVAWRVAAMSLAVTDPLPGGVRYRRVATRGFAPSA